MPYSIAKCFGVELAMAPSLLSRGNAEEPKGDSKRTSQGIRATFVRGTVQCQECKRPRAVYAKHPLNKLQKERDKLSGTAANSVLAEVSAAVAGANRSEPAAGPADPPSTGGIADVAAASGEAAACAEPPASGAEVTASDADVTASDASGASDAAEPEAASGSAVCNVPPVAASSGRGLRRPRQQQRSVQGGTYVWDEVSQACTNDQYTCGSRLMPVGHSLEFAVYCSESLTCDTHLERTLYSCTASVLRAELVDFDKSLCSVCGLEQLTKQQRKQQGCSGDAVAKWSCFPVCEDCSAQGAVPAMVRKSKVAASSAVRNAKRKAAAQHASNAVASKVAAAPQATGGTASSEDVSCVISSSDDDSELGTAIEDSSSEEVVTTALHSVQSRAVRASARRTRQRT